VVKSVVSHAVLFSVPIRYPIADGGKIEKGEKGVVRCPALPYPDFTLSRRKEYAPLYVEMLPDITAAKEKDKRGWGWKI
jgi:hypothetical protein